MKVSWASIALLVVLLVAIGVVIWGGQIAARRAEAEKRFAFPDTGAIVEIHLVEKHADTIFRRIDLRRTPKGWLIGDTLPVFEQPLQTLLRTLVAQTPRAPVPQNALKNVLSFLREHRIEVTLRFRDGREEEFYVGGPTPDQFATYMLRPGSDQPYEVFLPGLEGYLTSRYYPDLGVWQSNQMFDARVADLYAIQVDYTGEPEKSWRLERPQPNAPWRLATEEPVDSFAVAEYLMAYSGPFYADELTSADSLVGLSTIAEVQLFLWKGKKYHWSVYPHSSSALHYYVRLWHSPYFVYIISRHTLDRLLYKREQFVKRSA
ncbi:MAG: DUF4340 domain-containing protein [Bacteroidia bacterium]|nr:DUF4340 domain-containing protein [Bacteroidia bacterium]MCX7652292.1 DUF4340 domain-containing protein [Bacteroidia bacterium]MDW8416554.1 hypothetical protein [Bacteroidia bacterium]